MKLFMKSGIRLLLLSLLLAVSCQAFPDRMVRGLIFNDRNGNGACDRGESGIANVPVSNGKEVVLTDERGCYQLHCTFPVSVFPILPSGYRFSGTRGQVANSNFRYLQATDNGSEQGVNFGIQNVVEKEKYRFAAVGDVQVNDSAELDYASRSVLPSLAKRSDIDFGIMMGDIVNDKPSLFPAMKHLFEQTGFPVWTVYGNHDREVNDSTTSDAGYCRNFGASVYAFNVNKTHFLVLNNMQPKGRYGYEVRFSDDELTFVANELQLVPRNNLLVISLHGPLKYTRNKDRLLELLANRPNILVLSGHTHIVERYFHSNKGTVVPELGVGASCGTWWTGEKDASGVPLAIMQCGTPRGYFQINISGVHYSYDYRIIGDASGRQSAVWVNPPMSGRYSANATDSTRILLNLYGGSDSTVVILKMDSKLYAMKKVDAISPDIDGLTGLYNQKIYPTQGNSRIPLRKKNSPHLWMLTLPALKPASYDVTISASDNYGFSVEENKKIQVTK